MENELDAVRYWTYGDSKNPPLLMIHGFTGSHEGFQYLVPELEKTYYVIAPDLPGFGESPLDFEPWTIDTLAAATNRFAATLKQTAGLEKFHLVSHSMGGLVAASMLEQRPELFAPKTVFISPVATKVKYFDSRKLGAVFGALHYNIGKRTGKFGNKLVRSQHISRLATNMIMTERNPEFRKQIHRHHFKNLKHISSIDFYHRLHKDINRRGVIDYASALKKFEVLLIAGTNDSVTPLRGERFLAKKIGAELATIPGVGHLAHYEKPREITRPLLDFLG